MVQKVYQRHNIAQHDMGYRKIDKDLIDRAKSDLLKELPHLFKKCDSDWFADWALSRRHKTRNTKKTKKTDTSTEQPLSDDEAPPPETAVVEPAQIPSGAGESSSKSSEARGLCFFIIYIYISSSLASKNYILYHPFVVDTLKFYRSVVVI